MKMRVLAMTVFAVLAAQAAMAANEGGDTWSTVQPAQQSKYFDLQAAPGIEGAAPGKDVFRSGSESGDTWSSLQALHETTVHQVDTQDRIARTESTYAVQTGASEGGDTWSRFAPQPQGRLTSTVGLPSKPAL